MFAPLPPFFVSRPSVVGALQRATEERLTEVVAPAGYGKSTLLSYWMRAHEAAPVTGLSLDRRDNDGRRLATRLVTALQHIHPGIGPLAIQNVDNSGESLGESFLSQLLGDIELAPSGVLVIDQAENITSPRVLDDLFTLIDLAPPTLRVVLATRNVPEHRWVREPEHQFRMADLAFRPDEAAVLLRRVSGRNLSRQQLDSVFQRTEGWPAGLQMFGIALRGLEDIDELIDGISGADREISGYLTDAVLVQQPEEVRQFLVQTSVLHNLTPELCRAVTGEVSSAELLRTLEQHSLFLMPADGSVQEANSFRYLELFKERLRRELVVTSPGVEVALLKSAAEWHLQNGERELAIEYLIEAREWGQVLDLAVELARPMFEKGHAADLLRWLYRVPEVIRRTRQPMLLVEAIVLTMVGSTVKAEDRIDSLMESRTPSIWELAVIKALRAVWVGNHCNPHQAIEDANAVLEGLELASSPDYPELRGLVSVANLRVVAALSRARSCWYLGDCNTARRELHDLLGESFDYHLLRIETLGSLGLVEIWSGHLREAHRAAVSALIVASKKDLSGQPSSMDALLVMSSLCRERGQLDRSEKLLDEALTLALGAKRWAAVAIHTVERAALDLALGELCCGIERLETFASAGHPTVHPLLARRLDAARVRMHLAAGDISVASRILATSEYRSHIEMQLLQVQLRLRCGELEVASELLRDLSGDDTRSQIEFNLYSAYLSNSLGDAKLAQQHLSRALCLAEPEAYLRVFSDCGVELIPILSERSADHPSPYSESVLSHLNSDSRGVNVTHQTTLSTRERMVLRYLPSSYSNAELAAHLFISQNTVKSHLHSIYRQLEVTGRREAVIEAERRGLL